jgi:hypothetical protein
MNREGDPTGAAGKMAPQVTEEFAAREQRVQKNKQKDEIRDRQENEGRRPGQQEQEEQEEQRQPRNRRHIDLRA